MPGRYGLQNSLDSSPLSDLYPVVMDHARPTGIGSSAPGHFALTQSGQRSLLTQLGDTDRDSAEVWRTLPGFHWYAGVKRAKAGSEILAVHQREATASGRVPLIVTKTYGTQHDVAGALQSLHYRGLVRSLNITLDRFACRRHCFVTKGWHGSKLACHPKNLLDTGHARQGLVNAILIHRPHAVFHGLRMNGFGLGMV